MKRVYLMLALYFSFFLLSACSSNTGEKRHNSKEIIAQEAAVGSLVVVDISDSTNTTLLDEKRLELDTMVLISKLKEDISKLLVAKDPNFINDTIFGDCLYSYLSPNDSLGYMRTNASDPVLRKDVAANFDKILISKEIKEALEQQSSEDVFFYINDGRTSDYPFIYNYKDQMIIHTYISFNESLGEFSKLYWFGYIDEKWKFCGLTCVG